VTSFGLPDASPRLADHRLLAPDQAVAEAVEEPVEPGGVLERAARQLAAG
jgi:hypothetical protein